MTRKRSNRFKYYLNFIFDFHEALFLCQGILSQFGDRMWLFAAYLLLTRAFPEQPIVLGES